MLEKDPNQRITVEKLKEHPWLNENRTPLSEETPEKITVTDEEVKKSLHFFLSTQFAKKCGVIWKLKSLKNRESTMEIKEKTEKHLAHDEQ